MRPSLNRTTEIKIRCTKQIKEKLSRKLIAIGYKRTKKGNAVPDLTNYLEALSDMPLEWFEKYFQKSVDK